MTYATITKTPRSSGAALCPLDAEKLKLSGERLFCRCGYEVSVRDYANPSRSTASPCQTS